MGRQQDALRVLDQFAVLNVLNNIKDYFADCLRCETLLGKFKCLHGQGCVNIRHVQLLGEYRVVPVHTNVS